MISYVIYLQFCYFMSLINLHTYLFLNLSTLFILITDTSDPHGHCFHSASPPPGPLRSFTNGVNHQNCSSFQRDPQIRFHLIYPIKRLRVEIKITLSFIESSTMAFS